MKTFKKLLINISTTLFFSYLATSFICLDFNFMNWSQEARLLTVLGSLALRSIALIIKEFNDDDD
jgi:hypothetical protein